MSYAKLSHAFATRTPFKYDKWLHFDGTKVIGIENSWKYVGNRWQRGGTQKVVLAEWVEHNGKQYSVVYNRGNKCFASEVMHYGFNNSWRQEKIKLKYGEIGKPDKDQQIAYKCQMIDALIYSGSVQYLLIPTTLEGDSDFFKLI